MKFATILTCAFAAVFAVQLEATPTWATINTSAYTGDKSNGANYAKYTAYLMSTDDASDYFGGSDIKSIQNSLNEEFSSETPADGIAFADPYYFGGQYTLDKYVAAGFTSSDYVALVFYGNEAYRVFAAGSATLVGENIVFDDTSAAQNTVGEWQKAVPEPTSGLLLLIGLAGIALKRKREK